MFCTKCGTPNLDADQFCRNCSTPLIKPRDMAGSAQAPPRPSYNPQPYNPQSGPIPPPYPGYSGYPVSQPGYSPQMAGAQQKASGQSIAALIVSILSLVTCCLPIGIIGAVIGKMEMNAIREGRSSQAGETMAKVGYYLGMTTTVISGFFYLFGFLSSLLGH